MQEQKETERYRKVTNGDTPPPPTSVSVGVGGMRVDKLYNTLQIQNQGGGYENIGRHSGSLDSYKINM